MKAMEHIFYGPLKDQHMNIYLPEDVSKDYDLIVWFHGGGLEAGDDHWEDFMGDLLQAGVGIVSAQYRMYPEARYPEFLLDAASAVKYVQKDISERPEVYGACRRLYISGASAGAYLTMMLCMNPAFLRNAGVDPASISGFISDSAQVTTHFNVLRERGMDSRLERIDEAAPLYYVSPELTFSRLLMIAYEQDMPCRPEQNALMVKSIKRLCPKADVQYVVLPGGHCHGCVHRSDNGQYDYVTETVRFLKEK